MEMELISGEDAGINPGSINQHPVPNRALSMESSISLFNYIKEGSAISSVAILLVSSLGSTIIIVPYSIKDLGISLGVLLLVLASLINYFASYCLILVSDRTGRITYKGLGDELFGSKYGVFFEIFMIIACYLRMLLDFISLVSIFAYLLEKSSPSWFWVWYLSGLYITLGVIVGLAMLCLKEGFYIEESKYISPLLV
jgi:amino acid permease